MKKIISFFAALLCAAFVFAEARVTESCLKLLDDFFDLRMELSCLDTEKDVSVPVNRLEEFKTKRSSEINSLSREEKAVVNSLIGMERYNYLFGKPENKELLKKELKVFVDEYEAFTKDKKNEDFDSWVLTVKADLLSCYITVSTKDVMKYGLVIKEYYETACKISPDFFLSPMNLGQWYYWAPGISGGSKKKALSYCETAYKNSRKPYKKYYACIHYSQMLFENKMTDKAFEILSEADSVCPGSYWLKTIRENNEKGKSLYEYNSRKTE